MALLMESQAFASPTASGSPALSCSRCLLLPSSTLPGATVWTLTYRRKEPVPEDTFNGVIGGLVAACASSSIVEPYAAAVIGERRQRGWEAGRRGGAILETCF